MLSRRLVISSLILATACGTDRRVDRGCELAASNVIEQEWVLTASESLLPFEVEITVPEDGLREVYAFGSIEWHSSDGVEYEVGISDCGGNGSGSSGFDGNGGRITMWFDNSLLTTTGSGWPATCEPGATCIIPFCLGAAVVDSVEPVVAQLAFYVGHVPGHDDLDFTCSDSPDQWLLVDG